MIPTIPIHASSFRVFRGYKKLDITEEAFLKDLGQTFMPGTPLMLRELGLAAYLPSVLPQASEARDLPDEVAIIAYPSREQYAWVRNQTVVGRMYTYTHHAVFDMAKSRSVFPEPIGASQDPINVFYAFGTQCDWQADGDVVFWAGRKRDGIADGAFASQFLAELTAILPALRDAAVRECVGQADSSWAVLWLLIGRRSDRAVVPPDLSDILARSLLSSAALMVQLARRHVWRDQPPSVDVMRASSHTFIFQRDVRHFIR